jgi:hypothetical protein
MASRGDRTFGGQSGASILAFPSKSELAKGAQPELEVALRGSPYFCGTDRGNITTGYAAQYRHVESPESPLSRWLGALGFSASQVAAVDARVGMVVSATRHGTTREKALSALARDVSGSAKATSY